MEPFMFDLTSIIPKETVEVDLLHPVTGAPLEASFTMAGPSHPATVAIQRKQMDRRLKKGLSSLGGPTTTEALEKDSVEALAARTLGWKGMVKAGEPLAFSPEAAAEIYADPKLGWLRRQVSDALGDDAVFFVK